MYEKLKEKYPSLTNRKRVLLQQDNAKPHTANRTAEKIVELEGIELLPHPAYSPDLALVITTFSDLWHIFFVVEASAMLRMWKLPAWSFSLPNRRIGI